jgi:hypothetical protein
MTLEQAIGLFESIEKGEEGQVIGLHLHRAIVKATEQSWRTNQSYPNTFSGFLTAIKDHEPIDYKTPNEHNNLGTKSN